MVTRTPTVGAYLDYWLREVVRPNLAPKTVDDYERFTRLYLVPGLGKKNLGRLSSRDVQTWINTLAKTCQCCAQSKDAARLPKKRRCCAIGQCCEQYPSASQLYETRPRLRIVLN